MSAVPPLTLGATLRWFHIRQLVRGIDPRSVLEVGCGLGAMGYRLAENRSYRAYEPDAPAAAVARARMSNLANADVRSEALPLHADRTFDMVVAFEVLEHLEDDVEILRHWREWTAPGGNVLFSVPAGPHRFGAWDERVGHLRRYSRPELERILGESGWEPLSIRAWGMPLGYGLEMARNCAARLSQDGELSVSDRTSMSGRLLQPRSIPAGLIAAVAAPFTLLQAPFARSSLGIGFVVLAHNPRR